MSMKSRDSHVSLAPRGEGSRPLFWLLAAAGAALPACSGGGSADQVTGPVTLGMTSTMAPYYSDGKTTIYEAQKPVTLPVRRPSDAERHGLGPAPRATPYPRAPFLLAADESVEVHYVLTNVDDAPHAVWMLVDPWNEFVRWRPGITVVSDEVTVPNFGFDKAFSIPPRSRVEGTLTSDDLHEIATKLASVENLLASSYAQQAQASDAGASSYGAPSPTTLCNNIFNSLNRSNSGDPLYTPWIPPVIAGVTGFDLGIRTYEAANVAVEITIDVVDLNGNRFVQQDDTSTTKLGLPPRVLSPPAARF
jgi:hypothetical protein